MQAQNLVLEISPEESAADVEVRLNQAAEDGFFLVNVVGRMAFLRTSVVPKDKKPEPELIDLPVDADAVTAIRHGLHGKAQMSLQALRKVARFTNFPEKVWYGALQSLVEAGAIVLRQEQSHGGHKRTVVLVKA